MTVVLCLLCWGTTARFEHATYEEIAHGFDSQSVDVLLRVLRPTEPLLPPWRIADIHLCTFALVVCNGAQLSVSGRCQFALRQQWRRLRMQRRRYANHGEATHRLDYQGEHTFLRKPVLPARFVGERGVGVLWSKSTSILSCRGALRRRCHHGRIERAQCRECRGESGDCGHNITFGVFAQALKRCGGD